ncbi:hypothetical protein Bpfe_021068 [Biomphalaria pfeifferi]|uniref:Uncharacterized protein n=1 Tax=Biomphalaria pfeifferi TaxID=112525 RepID=A0AAD8F2P3_BIOPF|nr:hypothetical protein Bpfe_021068 [Biomphalaria pfeifferi]
MNRDADILACQLQSLLVEVNPLKEEKTALEEKLKTKAFEMERLADRIECNEALFRQRRAVDDLNKKLEVELGNVKRSNSKLVTKFNALTSSHYDLKREYNLYLDKLYFHHHTI